MELQQALILFDALSQETRLSAFRLLVKAGPEGLAAGRISEQLNTPHNTMSFHLTHLVNAGIVHSKKQGRSVIYMADFERMNALISYMVKDCCSGEMANIHEDTKTGSAIIKLSACCGTSAVTGGAK
ncbi:ArsR/SmtB family transcription factor [Methylophaga sp.]|uniref:ArsR/SmtB family transcription factor n=1 Tax=Methylophaga sp. TaxID=2024840 RepID=UPI003F69CAC6